MKLRYPSPQKLSTSDDDDVDRLLRAANDTLTDTELEALDDARVWSDIQNAVRDHVRTGVEIHNNDRVDTNHQAFLDAASNEYQVLELLYSDTDLFTGSRLARRHPQPARCALAGPRLPGHGTGERRTSPPERQRHRPQAIRRHLMPARRDDPVPRRIRYRRHHGGRHSGAQLDGHRARSLLAQPRPGLGRLGRGRHRRRGTLRGLPGPQTPGAHKPARLGATAPSGSAGTNPTTTICRGPPVGP